MITYYKSRFLSPPVVYVQHDESWKSYAPGGRIQNNLGPLPSHILQNVEEVSYVEVEDLVREYSAEAGRLEAERRLPPPEWGIGGWLILPIIGLFVSCIGSLYSLFREVIPILRSWDTFTSPDSSLYHPLLGPYFGFITFIDVAIFVVSIFLLVLIFKRKHILPTIIIYAYTAFVFVTLVDFVAVVTFIYQFMAERGDAAEASSFVTQGIVDVVLRGIITCGIWIPYFLYSKRVRNTFDQPWNSKRAALSHTTSRAATWPRSRLRPRPRPPPRRWCVGEADLIADAAAEDAGPAEVPVEEAPQPLGTGERPMSAPTPQSRILLIPLVAIMVIILGVVIGLGVWRSANPPQVANPVTVTTDANGNTLKHYSNTATGFSFDYPADWVLDSSRAPGSLPGFQVNVRDPQGARIDNEAGRWIHGGRLRLVYRRGVARSFRTAFHGRDEYSSECRRSRLRDPYGCDRRDHQRHARRYGDVQAANAERGEVHGAHVLPDRRRSPVLRHVVVHGGFFGHHQAQGGSHP